jgi:hypothetical protein
MTGTTLGTMAAITGMTAAGTMARRGLAFRWISGSRRSIATAPGNGGGLLAIGATSVACLD